MKKKFLAWFLLLLLVSSVFAVTYEMKDTSQGRFSTYVCVSGGGSDPANPPTSIFTFDIDIGGCLSELYVCWMEGFCGARILKDVWGVVNVVATPKVMPLDTTLNIDYTIKNFSTTPINNQSYSIYVKDLVTGAKLPATVQTKTITLAANQSVAESVSYNVSTPGFKEGGNYLFMVSLPTLTNDDPSNNIGSDDFTVITSERPITVPDSHPLLAVLVALSVLAIIFHRSGKK